MPYTDNYKLSSHIMGNTLSPVLMKELIKGVLFINSEKVNNISFDNGNLSLVS